MKNLSTVLVFSFCLFAFLSTTAQSELSVVDSLVLRLKTEKNELAKNNLRIQIARLIKYNDYTETEKLLSAVFSARKNEVKPDDLAEAHKIMGIVQDEKVKYKESISEYLKAIALYRQLNDTISVARCEANIGMVYRKYSMPDEALVYFKKCLPVFQRAGFTEGINLVIQNIGVVHFDRKNYDSALYYFLEAKKMNQKDGTTDYNLEGNIGNVYIKTNKPKEALRHIEKLLNFLENEGGPEREIIFWKLNLLSVYEKLGMVNEIRVMTNDVAGYYSKQPKELDHRIARQLAISFTDCGQHESATEFALKADSILENEKDSAAMKEMMMLKEKYDAGNRERQIAELHVLKEKQNLEISNQRMKLYTAGACLTIAFISGIFAYRSYRRKIRDNLRLSFQHAEIQKQKDIIEEKNKEVLDSIRYAKRIQQALLPSEKYINRVIKKDNNSK